jgi:hypothetical protein
MAMCPPMMASQNQIKKKRREPTMRAGKIIELYQPERQTRSRTQRDIMQARYEEAMNWCHITLDAAIALGIVAFAETVLLVFTK